MKLEFVNWWAMQHYKDRRPPWVKLYVDIIDEYDAEGREKKFRRLPDDAKLTFMMLVCLATRYDGMVPQSDAKWIAHATGISAKHVMIKPLMDAGYLVACDSGRKHASKVASKPASKVATVMLDSETETETETEGEGKYATAIAKLKEHVSFKSVPATAIAQSLRAYPKDRWMPAIDAMLRRYAGTNIHPPIGKLENHLAHKPKATEGDAFPQAKDAMAELEAHGL